ncbi:hypothetical protein NPIL_576531 [Nephila pilipes]|uniref:Uncharacterized protein n=1 Tax=Nephila pilipes TaxID=299642 RepID=A0A8X6MX57_NEPPI|nr:hypothetical protein NPIL_576531 [Nephila pilipes]
MTTVILPQAIISDGMRHSLFNEEISTMVKVRRHSSTTDKCFISREAKRKITAFIFLTHVDAGSDSSEIGLIGSDSSEALEEQNCNAIEVANLKQVFFQKLNAFEAYALKAFNR